MNVDLTPDETALILRWANQHLLTFDVNPSWEGSDHADILIPYVETLHSLRTKLTPPGDVTP